MKDQRPELRQQEWRGGLSSREILEVGINRTNEIWAVK